MNEFIISRNVADLHAKPDFWSEQVTQAILGARVRVRQEEGDYCFVDTADRYQGWVEKTRLIPAGDDSDNAEAQVVSLFAPVYQTPDDRSTLLTKLVLSTRIRRAAQPESAGYVPALLPDQQVGYVSKECLVPADAPTGRVAQAGRIAVAEGQRLIGTPYLWGGCTPFGIDCSGFVQLAYKLAGVALLRDADIQFRDRRFTHIEEGKGLDSAALEPGDLLVFSSREDRRITHIGMALGDGRFIHSSGRCNGVAIDSCCDPYRIQSFVGAARLSANADPAVEAA